MIGNKFNNILIEEEYGIMTKPAYPGNPQENTIIERINQVLGNIVGTYNTQEIYVDNAEPWMGILVADAFKVHYIYFRVKGKITRQMVLG